MNCQITLRLLRYRLVTIMHIRKIKKNVPSHGFNYRCRRVHSVCHPTAVGLVQLFPIGFKTYGISPLSVRGVPSRFGLEETRLNNLRVLFSTNNRLRINLYTYNLVVTVIFFFPVIHATPTGPTRIVYNNIHVMYTQNRPRRRACTFTYTRSFKYSLWSTISLTLA